MTEQNHILDAVYGVILERKASQAENSYTASLMRKGLDSVLKKVGEEATELVIAGKGGVAEEGRLRGSRSFLSYPAAAWVPGNSAGKKCMPNCVAVSASPG
jgi:hypothetical protein